MAPHHRRRPGSRPAPPHSMTDLLYRVLGELRRRPAAARRLQLPPSPDSFADHLYETTFLQVGLPRGAHRNRLVERSPNGRLGGRHGGLTADADALAGPVGPDDPAKAVLPL